MDKLRGQVWVLKSGVESGTSPRGCTVGTFYKGVRAVLVKTTVLHVLK